MNVAHELRPAPDTPWTRGRFDAARGPRQILFGSMYEDPSIEADVLPPGRVFCIASAGDTALALAEGHDVVAADINPVQLAYARRRIAGERVEIGTAERVMAFGRRLFPLAGWRRKDIETFLALDDTGAQVAFWRERLDTRAFRFGIDRLLSFAALRRVYSTPLLDCLPENLGEVMRARMARCWARHPNRTNPYARALLTGQPVIERAPPPRRSIQLVGADAASYLESCPPRSFSGFTLSNILDGAPSSYRERLFAAVRRAGTDGAVLVLRSFSEPRDRDANLWAARDRSMLWGQVHVWAVRELSGEVAS